MTSNDDLTAGNLDDRSRSKVFQIDVDHCDVSALHE